MTRTRSLAASSEVLVPLRAAYWGHHKCGSQWITEIVSRVCAILRLDYILEDHAMWFPERQLDERYGDGRDQFVVCWNSDFLGVRTFRGRGFHVIRDPRDVIVSGYYSHLNSHGEQNWPRLSAHRDFLRTLDKEEGLFAEMHFSSPYLHQMYWWDYDNPLVFEVKFEHLIDDPFGRFCEIFRHLGILPERLAEKDLAEILDQTSFSALSGGRKAGEEDVRHHFRKGVAGEWRTEFNPEHVEFFRRLYNPVLIKTGYANRDDW